MPGWTFILILSASAVFSFLTHTDTPAWALNPTEEEIEMLDVIEVQGAAVEREPQHHTFPTPAIDSLRSFPDHHSLEIPFTLQIDRPAPQARRNMDPIGKTRGLRTSVKPIKAPRPTYPRFAREQGWEGTAILRVAIEADGKVATVTTQKSSGFQILDESATQAVKQWGFAPAKNGEFAVASVVDIPIRFDLDQQD